MTGGEPVLARGNYELIETCVAEGWAADIELMLNTNMTVNSPGFFESFRHFRRVQLNCSLDGFGSMNDYLRFPSRWREVSANLDSFLKLPGNIRTTVCVVVQFHNVLNLTDLLRDIDRRRAEAAPRHVNFDLILLRDPSFLSMTLLPEKIRRLAAARLRDFSRSSALCREDAVSRAGVDATIRTLSMENREAPRGLLEKNARFTSILDKARGVEMKDFIPELHAMMES